MKSKNIVLALALLTSGHVYAQTLEEIVNKHVEAIGGKDILAQVKSVYTESMTDVMGTQAPTIEYQLDGKGYRTETEFNGSKIVTALNDKAGWSINPLAGSTDAVVMPDEIYKAGRSQIFIGSPLYDLQGRGYKAELLGKEDNLYKLKVLDGTSEATYYLDTATYYISKKVTKGEMMGQAVEVTTSFSDYKKTTAGIVIPYSRTIDFGSFAVTSKTEKAEINKEFDQKLFEKP